MKRKKKITKPHQLQVSQQVELQQNELVPQELTPKKPSSLLSMVFSNPVMPIADGKRLEVNRVELAEEKERHNVPMTKGINQWSTLDYARVIGAGVSTLITGGLYLALDSWVTGAVFIISLLSFVGWLTLADFAGTETVKTKSKARYSKVKR